MNTKTKATLVATALAASMAALATPPLNLVAPILASGNISAPIEEHGVAQTNDGEFHVKLETDGPSTIVIQGAAFAPGGSIGWHSHSGMVLVQVVSGTIRWYDHNCNATVYKAGDAWTEGNSPHYFRNIGTTTANVVATLIIARGAAPRIDQPAPDCAIALGLN